MTAPVIGFTAEVPLGLQGESCINIEPVGNTIEITLVDWPFKVISSERTLIVSHDEARQIIAGLASVIQ